MLPIIVKQKTDIVRARPFDTVETEPKTLEIHLKLGHAEDPQESLKAGSTGFKVNYSELVTHN
jgi:kinesin family protein 22